MERIITHNNIAGFAKFLAEKEKSPATIEKYARDLRQFAGWIAGEPVIREKMIEWKKHMQEQKINPRTINAKICALNAFTDYMGWQDCRLKSLKIQRTMFRDTARELTKGEYRRLIETAEKLNNHRLALIIETFGGTGMRVSELQYLTVQTAAAGKIEISLKGKIRIICIEKKLARHLLDFADKQGITEGCIFTDKCGNPMSRKLVWAQMKALAVKAGVDCRKVFPHNLRHLFARTYYKVTRNLAELASLLGHSSIETTRIYLLTTAESQQKRLSSLHMLC